MNNCITLNCEEHVFRFNVFVIILVELILGWGNLNFDCVINFSPFSSLIIVFFCYHSNKCYLPLPPFPW